MKRLLILSVFLLALGVLPQFAAAQFNAAGIGLTNSFINRPATPGETITDTVGVKNLSGATQTYYIFTRDIVGVTDSNGPVFAEEGQELTGYEMSSWITTSLSEVTLEPDQEVPVDVTIAVPDFATPGSHFAGIFVSMDPPKMRSVGAAVAYQVAAIATVNVAGDVYESAKIRQFSTGNYIYGKSEIDFTARVENEGSTLIQPIGPLEIYNMFGKRVALLTFNESKAAVFPSATREFNIVWSDEGPGFGRYEAQLSLVYGSQGKQQTITSTVSFWILPANIILPALGVLLFLLLVTVISVKLYIRRKVMYSQLGGARRIVRRRHGGGMSAMLLVVVVMLAVTALFLLVLLMLFA